MKKLFLYAIVAMCAVNTAGAATEFISLRTPVEMRTTMSGDEKAGAAIGRVETEKNFSPLAVKHDQTRSSEKNSRRGPVGFVISAATLVVLVLILLILI